MTPFSTTRCPLTPKNQLGYVVLIMQHDYLLKYFPCEQNNTTFVHISFCLIETCCLCAHSSQCNTFLRFFSPLTFNISFNSLQLLSLYLCHTLTHHPKECSYYSLCIWLLHTVCIIMHSMYCTTVHWAVEPPLSAKGSLAWSEKL